MLVVKKFGGTSVGNKDRIMNVAKRCIEDYKKLKQAVITQAITKGVRGEREMKDSGVAWIGEIPKEWDIIKSSRIIKTTQNGLSRRDLEKSEGQIILKLKNITSDGKIDYSLLLDGLMAEREQGITIDVAYRYFTTDNSSFIVADTPGHEEYTRYMAVGASFADLAVILLDATQGVLVQTRRHARICALMGIKYFIFAVNKMDLAKYSEERFREIEKQIEALKAELDLENVYIVPVSATEGDNVTKVSDNMTWYEGKPILSILEQVDIDENQEEGFYLPVQRVCRPNHQFRGFQGQIESGSIKVGDEITALPSMEKAHVKSIHVTDKDVQSAEKGQPVTIQLDREVDVSRGCVLSAGAGEKVTSSVEATLLWMDDDKLESGKNYFVKLGTRLVPGIVSKILYSIDVNTGEQIVSDKLNKNEIAVCKIGVTEKIVLDEFEKHRSLGHFILIDRITNMTAACGVVNHVMRRTDDLFWQEMDVTRNVRANMKNQTPLTLWFTGLSGAGKSTIANEIEKRLVIAGKHTMCLDGDNVRLGLNKDLGFVEKDRGESIRRIAEVAKLFNDAGLIVITSCISPYELDRDTARKIIGNSNFVEEYVSTPLSQCEIRDDKG